MFVILMISPFSCVVISFRHVGVYPMTPAVTAMAGAQTTINNQLNASMATAMETATMMTMETKATVAAEAQWQRGGGGGGGGGGQLGSGGGSLARARGWRRWQRGVGVGKGKRGGYANRFICR